MRISREIFTALISSMLAGITASFLTSLLIYFKQRATVHHGLVLLVSLMIFIAFMLWFPKNRQISIGPRACVLIILVLIGSLYPQFLYQVRPYTFYISGLAMIGVMMTVGASLLATGRRGRYALIMMVLFVLSYFTGSFLSPASSQKIIFLFSMLLVVAFAVENQAAVNFLPAVGMVVIGFVFWQFAQPITYFEQQKSFEDKVVFSKPTQYHDLVITQWQRDYWFFVDKLKNVSSIDEYLYYEPMVHGVMKLVPEAREVLVIGGENGCLVREVLKWGEVSAIDVVSHDTTFRNLGMHNAFFLQMNQGALQNDIVDIRREVLFGFLNQCNKKYQAVFIDLPDPRDIETNQYYTIEFYLLIKNVLAEGGLMITQAGSPYFATQAYFSIGETLREAGFSAVPLHNQILTLGEWGWFACSVDMTEEEIKRQLNAPLRQSVPTRWYNDDAALLISSFGKTYLDTLQVGINTLDNPVVYQYYLKGNWKLN